MSNNAKATAKVVIMRPLREVNDASIAISVTPPTFALAVCQRCLCDRDVDNHMPRENSRAWLT